MEKQMSLLSISSHSSILSTASPHRRRRQQSLRRSSIDSVCKPSSNHQDDDAHKELPKIEIFPGFSTRLRGAEETWKSIEEGDYLPVTCLTCTMNLCCILDADYVICPICDSVTPMIENPSGEGGVGLGISGDDVTQHFADKNGSSHADETLKPVAIPACPTSSPNHTSPRGTVSLYDIFPKHVADALADGRRVEAEEKEEVTM
jgi:hypothetical protein